jgi:hypothetical protein
MTLAEKLRPELSDWSPAGRATLEVACPDQGWTVRLTADHNDIVGALAWELALERTAPPPAGATIRGWAESITARSSGLMERVKLLEVDGERSEALLRSDAPSAKGSVAGYYEIRLDGTRAATVRRYEADRKAGTPREQVSFTVTRDALLKLVDDIAG